MSTLSDPRLVPANAAFLPTLIINLLPGSPAAGTCQDERHGLEMREREYEKVGQHNTHTTCPVAREVLCMCVCVCDVKSNTTVRPSCRHTGMISRCVCVCVSVGLMQLT